MKSIYRFYYQNPLINKAISRNILKAILIGYNLIHNKKKVKGKNRFSWNFVLLNNNRFDIVGNSNEIIIADETRIINTKFTIIGNNNKIIISGNCTIRNSEFWIEDENNKIEIGNKTRINGAHIAITEYNKKILIGSDCLFSSEIDIRNGDSHSIIDLDTGSRINIASDINIGNHVWLAKDVKVLKGSEIGMGSIIGTGAIVTTNIPSNSLAVGNPARVIKQNVTWKIERIYD
jgi:acetyltransferase-like isoleucine patch superfamily enzyme